MGFPCPRCNGHYTQSLPMVYGAGTSNRNWRSSSGYGGRTVSQNLLAQSANPPLKRSVIKPLLWLLVVWATFGGTIVSTLSRLTGTQNPMPTTLIVDGPKYLAHHRHAAPPRRALGPDASEQILWTVVGIGSALTIFLLWLVISNFRFNRKEYPKLFNQWRLAFMCRDCGSLFYPPDAHSIMLGR